MAVTQGLQGVGAFALAQLARQAHDVEAALAQLGVQRTDAFTGVGEHQRAGAFEEAQQVDDRVLDLVRGDADGAIFDVAVRLVAADRVDADGVVLVALGQLHDVTRQGGREQQGAALGLGGVEDELQVFAEAHVQHLVGLVEDGDLQLGQVQVAALDVVAQAARRTDDDVGAVVQGALLAASVHAADAVDDHGLGLGVQPGQLAIDLHGQFAGRGDDQAQRLGGAVEGFSLAQQGRRGGQTERDGLARAGLGADQQVALGGVGFQHGGLDGGGLEITLSGESPLESGVGGGEGHMGPVHLRAAHTNARLAPMTKSGPLKPVTLPSDRLLVVFQRK